MLWGYRNTKKRNEGKRKQTCSPMSPNARDTAIAPHTREVMTPARDVCVVTNLIVISVRGWAGDCCRQNHKLCLPAFFLHASRLFWQVRFVIQCQSFAYNMKTHTHTQLQWVENSLWWQQHTWTIGIDYNNAHITTTHTHIHTRTILLKQLTTERAETTTHQLATNKLSPSTSATAATAPPCSGGSLA